MLEKLRQALEALVRKMESMNNALVDGEKVRSFTESEQTEYSRMESEANSLREQIKRTETLEANKREVERLDSTTRTASRIEVTREANHNDAGEYRGYAEFNKGGFGEFLQDVRSATTQGVVSEKFKQLRAALGANEAVGAEGGSLIQSDHAQMLFDNAKDSGVIAAECTSIPVSSNSTTIKLLDETSIADGSQYGGIQAFWRAEAGSVSATKPKFREVNVKLEALEALFYATEEQLEDAPQLETFANIAFSKVMGWKLDDAIVGGNGAGKPLGILNAPCSITIAKEGGQTADTVNFANVDKMVDRLMVESAGKAKWYIHPNVRQQLRAMVQTPGSNTDFKIFQPANGDIKTDSLLGYDVKRIQQARALGDLGDIFLADFSQYALFRKSGIKASQSMHVAFLTSEKAFKWTMRVNGMPLLNSAVTDAYGSTTRSPFILLAERA